MNSELNRLKTRLTEVSDLQSAGAVLSWDHETYMPPKGGPARARQMATLQRLAHEKFIDPEMGELLEKLLEYAGELPDDSDDAALIRKTHRDYDRIKRVPADRYAALVQHAANTYPVWAQAREENNFPLVAPNLEKTLELSQELSSYFTGFDHIADPLIDSADPGMKVTDIRRVFSNLRAELAPLVAEISRRPPTDDSCLKKFYPEKEQAELGMQAILKFGFDSNRCRQDKTRHPFMTKFSHGDIRITTRYKDHDFSDGFFSTLHEMGHALYEMGIDPAYDGGPLGTGTSAGVHESQSRLWENMVGRSRDFWCYFFPQAQAHFPAQLGDISLEEFYRAVNKVYPSLIRTDADEVTYNLHVMIRFDLEIDMLEGKLAINDLPDAWNARYGQDLGVVPETDADGVLQDVHWYAGVIGGSFQGYTLGNIISAQVWEAALGAHPEIPDEIGRGQMEALRTWLQGNIYRHGSKYLPDELLARVVGGALDTAPLMRYLRSKYKDIYDLDG